jgi:cobalt/nickel transport system permease protein
MHIMEGFLPLGWAAFWSLVALPFLIWGVVQIQRSIGERHERLALLAVSGAFIFVLSSLKLPSVTGSCSHPTGTGLSATLFGPAVTAVLGAIVLLYQAFFLAHGGLTTLGANIVSMGIAGPFAGYAIFRLGQRMNLNLLATVFAAATMADLVTYCVTSLQLALAFPATSGGVLTSLATFLGIFAVTQVPLAVVEGLIIALVFKYLLNLRADVLGDLGVRLPRALAGVIGR